MAEQAKTGSNPPPRWLLKLFSKAHVALNRASFGRLFNTLSGDEVCFVTMLGAKSGKWITMPLMYVPYRDGVLLVASMGAPRKTRSGTTIFSKTQTLTSGIAAVR